MPFPPDVRREALVRAARHCCVCHRYKGVKVEVHHIQPEADGGPNTLDNAIVLCFDCHADAGHYNPRQPRGTKFSPEELRAAREKWFRIVKEGSLASPEPADVLYCRYLICRNIDIVSEILAGNFERIPVDKPLLVQNESSAFLAGLLDELRPSASADMFYGGWFANRDEYLRAHPDALPADRGSGNFSFYELLRVPTQDELLTKWSPGRALVKRLIESGARPGDFAIIGSFFQQCGTDHYQEDLILRPLWGVFLAATNTSDSPQTLTKLVAARGLGENFRAFQPLSDPAEGLTLPSSPIQPGATVIIPLGAVLGPLSRIEEQIWRRTDTDLERWGPVQFVAHSGTQQSGAHALLGPFLWPNGIHVTGSGLHVYQEVHELDLTNVYTLDRYWEAGCCPHLFFVRPGAEIVYGGPLLARGNSTTAMSTFTVLTGVTSVLIAELEDEFTCLDSIWLDDQLHRVRQTLTRGQVFAFAVSAGVIVRIEGWYVPRFQSPALNESGFRRAMLVDEFIHNRVSEHANLAQGDV